MQIDYYAATVPASLSAVQAALAEHVEISDVKPSKPFQGYHHGQEVVVSSWGGSIHLWHGGHNPHPFVKTSGAPSGPASAFLRKFFEFHSASRVDVYTETEGGRDEFLAVSDHLIKFARTKGIRTYMHFSPSDPEKGRTLEVGSRSSEVFLRYYEKDRELRDKGKTNGDGLVRNRAEFEVKPKNRARKLMLGCTHPANVPGFSRWAAEISSLWACSPELARRHAEAQTNARKSIEHMKAQYRNQMVNLMREMGRSAARNEFLGFWQDLENEAFPPSEGDYP